ncbi:neuromedin-U receptor 1-like [Clarias gariepinus]|uniref:neuromedin-U receptor 1-like n=1 Tax=Clarias gariepinus TaxID=13013 RepID=UPI00234C92EF|nr:neuromedin-U receptor 1-like [Clarias gariepinus]
MVSSEGSNLGIASEPLPKPHGHGEGPELSSAICTLVKPQWIYNLITQLSTLIFFILPMMTISTLYLLIAIQLKKEKMLQAKTEYENYGHKKTICQPRTQRQQVTKMLFVLVVMFGICWAPFYTDRLMWSFMDEFSSVKMFQVFEYVHIFSAVFFYLSSAVNPVLYNLMSTRFREMFKDVMSVHKRASAHRKFSLSMTRATVRSVLSDVANGNTTTDGDYEFYECHEKSLSG